MKSIAVYNLKGGVGKTATAVNLAWSASQAGWRTLLWDLDAQAASSWYLCAEANSRFKAGRLVRNRIALGKCIVKSAYPNLFVLPSNLSMRQIDVHLAAEEGSGLRQWLSALSETYELLIMDCPPSLSALAESILRECDVILMPAVPTPLSQATVQQVRDWMKTRALKRSRLYPVLTMIDRRKSLHREYVANGRSLFGRQPLGFIPYAAEVEKMGIHRAPIGTFAPHSPATLAYQLLWEDTCKALKLQLPPG